MNVMADYYFQDPTWALTSTTQYYRPILKDIFPRENKVKQLTYLAKNNPSGLLTVAALKFIVPVDPTTEPKKAFSIDIYPLWRGIPS